MNMTRKTHTRKKSSSSRLAVSLAARIAAAGVTLALLGTACSAGSDSSLEVVDNTSSTAPVEMASVPSSTSTTAVETSIKPTTQPEPKDTEETTPTSTTQPRPQPLPPPTTTTPEIVLPDASPAASSDRIVHMFEGSIEDFDVDTTAMRVRHLPVDKVNVREPRCKHDEDCGPYIVELRDVAGTKVATASLEVTESHWDGIDEDGRGIGGYTTSFKGHLIDPPDYDSFALVRDGEVLLVVERSAHAPTASLSGISEGQFFAGGEPLKLILSVEDKDDDDLRYEVFWKCEGDTCKDKFDKGYIGVPRRIPADTSSVTVNLTNQIPNTNRAQVAVAVYDGTRSAFIESLTFAVGEHAPTVRINTRQERLHRVVTGQEERWLEESRFSNDDDWLNNDDWFSICRSIFAHACIWLEGLGRDIDESLGFSYRGDGYSWSSDIDGHLGTGRQLRISAHELTLGNHVFTVTWTNSQGISATDSIEVVIEQAAERTDTVE